jgi:hypothetical protein
LARNLEVSRCAIFIFLDADNSDQPPLSNCV